MEEVLMSYLMQQFKKCIFWTLDFFSQEKVAMEQDWSKKAVKIYFFSLINDTECWKSPDGPSENIDFILYKYGRDNLST